MHSLIRSVRFVTTSTTCHFPILNSKYPRPILELVPQFRFLKTEPMPQEDINSRLTQSLLADVLRSNSYFDSTVFENVSKILTSSKSKGVRSDAVGLAKMRYIALVFHSITDKDKRDYLKEIATNLEKCKIPILKKEQDLFYKSIFPDDDVPEITQCMHKNDLLLCFFRRELESKNWKNVKELLSLYPELLNLYDHIVVFLQVAKHQKVADDEIINAFMNYATAVNPYFIEKAEYEIIFKNVQSIRQNITEIEVAAVQKCMKKTYISKDDLNVLKNQIDEFVKTSKEGFVKTKEYESVSKQVARWKKQKNINDGQNVVVVDALNFGGGADPKDWTSISSEFKHVVFATRTPRREMRESVMKRYKGDALFCDKLSSDDLIILRMALEFGPETSIITNDRYRDHRRGICRENEQLEKIWSDFLIDAVYRHYNGKIESLRNFNLRIFRDEKSGNWIFPVLDSEGLSEKFRNLKWNCQSSRATIEYMKIMKAHSLHKLF